MQLRVMVTEALQRRILKQLRHSMEEVLPLNAAAEVAGVVESVQVLGVVGVQEEAEARLMHGINSRGGVYFPVISGLIDAGKVKALRWSITDLHLSRQKFWTDDVSGSDQGRAVWDWRLCPNSSVFKVSGMKSGGR